jgi:hypothetical protein
LQIIIASLNEYEGHQYEKWLKHLAALRLQALSKKNGHCPGFYLNSNALKVF